MIINKRTLNSRTLNEHTILGLYILLGTIKLHDNNELGIAPEDETRLKYSKIASGPVLVAFVICF